MAANTGVRGGKTPNTEIARRLRAARIIPGPRRLVPPSDARGSPLRSPGFPWFSFRNLAKSCERNGAAIGPGGFVEKSENALGPM